MPKFTLTSSAAVFESTEQIKVLSDIAKKIGLVSFDTETTGLRTYIDTPVLMSVSFPPFSWEDLGYEVDPTGLIPNPKLGTKIVFETHLSGVDEFIKVLEDCDVIAHNWKFDAHMLYGLFGYVPGINGIVFDTQHMDWLHNENRSHGLKECCEDYGICYGMQSFRQLFGSIPKKIKAIYPNISEAEYALMNEDTRQQFFEYAALDAEVTYQLFLFLKEKLESQIWPSPYNGYDEDKTLFDMYVECESPLIKAVWEMEKNGAFCDPEILRSFEGPIQERLKEIEQEYAILSGRKLNLNSTPQLREFFFEELGLPVIKMTSGGKKGIKEPSLDVETLETLNEKYPAIISGLITYRKLHKLNSTYVVGLQECINPKTGRIHGTFNTHGTVTGRLSSSSPNLQNISNKEADGEWSKYDIRSAFRGMGDNLLIVADYSTLEIVITAHVSQDERLIKALNEGLDQHSYTASLMFGIDYDQIIEAKNAEHHTEEQKRLVYLRKAAKTLTFGILYGMGAHKLSGSLDISLDEAEDYINKFFQAYPGIKRSKDYWTEFCKVNGFVLTIMGRRRRIPEIQSRNFSVAKRAERQAFNAVIQGSAADLMRYYMPKLAFNQQLKELGGKLILQIHDEVVIEVPKEEAEKAKQIVDNVLSSAMPYVDWAVPLSADAKIASNWAEGK